MIGQDGLGDKVRQPGIAGGQGFAEMRDREGVLDVGELGSDETDGVIGPVQEVADNLVLFLSGIIQAKYAS